MRSGRDKIPATGRGHCPAATGVGKLYGLWRLCGDLPDAGYWRFLLGHGWRAAWINDLQPPCLKSGVFIGSPGSPLVERLLARLSEEVLPLHDTRSWKSEPHDVRFENMTNMTRRLIDLPKMVGLAAIYVLLAQGVVLIFGSNSQFKLIDIIDTP